MQQGALPVVFTAHGSPMNALPGGPFAAFLRRWGAELPRPRAILAVSAHWEGPDLAVTASPAPPTIHDFWGFPEPLYALRYPVAGSPELAGRVVELLRAAGLAGRLDRDRGLDHGAWSPLLHLYPSADVPVVQLSLLRRAPGSRHLAVGRALAPLAEEGVLVLGSGNVTHNLATADLRDREAPVERWAEEFDGWVAQRLLAGDAAALSEWSERGPHGRLAHPTAEHYVPLLVALGAAGSGRAVSFPHEGFEHGTLSMRCVAFS